MRGGSWLTALLVVAFASPALAQEVPILLRFRLAQQVQQCHPKVYGYRRFSYSRYCLTTDEDHTVAVAVHPITHLLGHHQVCGWFRFYEL